MLSWFDFEINKYYQALLVHFIILKFYPLYHLVDLIEVIDKD